MRNQIRMAGATICWTLLVVLALVWSLEDVGKLTVWIIILAQVTLLLTGWILAEDIGRRMVARAMRENEDRENRMVEQVARRLAEALREERLTSVR
jgi:hypothetical protein